MFSRCVWPRSTCELNYEHLWTDSVELSKLYQIKERMKYQMMHLIEDRTLLDANVSDGRRKLLNLLLPTLLFLRFFRFLFLFTLLYILGVKKHILFNKFLAQKKTANLTGSKRWRLRRKKGNYFCMLYPWHILFFE